MILAAKGGGYPVASSYCLLSSCWSAALTFVTSLVSMETFRVVFVDELDLVNPLLLTYL